MIELRNLRKSFGEVHALRGITADIPCGSVGLLGPNGAGKSTLLRVLLALLKPTTGRAFVLGLDSRTNPLEIRSRVGYMPEDDCHIPGLSAVGYVAFAAELSGLAKADAIRRAHEVLDYVSMDDERYRPVETYSSGMRQRIKLAQAIVHDPEVLLLDEPTNGMDPPGREDMLELIRDISSLGDISVLISSHLLRDVEQVCDHIVVLADGDVRLEGKLSEMQKTEGNRFNLRLRGDETRFMNALAKSGGQAIHTESGMLKVTMPEGTPAKKLVELAHLNNVQVRHLQKMSNTLEDVFMQALGES